MTTLAISPPYRFKVTITDSDPSSPTFGCVIPLTAGAVYTYITGTTTPLATYQDYQQMAANTNPIILNANGECDIFLLPQLYDFVIYTAPIGEGGSFVGQGIGINGAGGGGSGSLIVVDTITDLRLLTAGQSDFVITRGYNSATDNCPGEWLWEAEATNTDNSVTWISPDSAPTNGRWRLLYNGPITSRMAGLTGKSTDDAGAGIALLITLGTGDYLFETGTYKVATGAYTFPAGSNIQCQDGVNIQPASGAAISFNGGFSAPTNPPSAPLFSGAGTIDFSSSKNPPIGIPEWFGAIGDGSTDDSAAINLMFGSGFKSIRLNGIYGIQGAISLAMDVYAKTIIGNGNGFQLLANTSFIGVTPYIGEFYNCYIGTAGFNLNVSAGYRPGFFNCEFVGSLAGSADAITGEGAFIDCTFSYQSSTGSGNNIFRIGTVGTLNAAFIACQFHVNTHIDHVFIADGSSSVAYVYSNMLIGTLGSSLTTQVSGGHVHVSVETIDDVLTVPGSLDVGANLVVGSNAIIDGTTSTNLLNSAGNAVAGFGGTAGVGISRAGIGTKSYPAIGQIFTDFAAIAITNEGIQNLGSKIIPLNTLLNTSDSVEIIFKGSMTSQNARLWTFSVTLASTTPGTVIIATFPQVSNLAASHTIWEIRLQYWRTTNTSISVFGSIKICDATAATATQEYLIDTTPGAVKLDENGTIQLICNIDTGPSGTLALVQDFNLISFLPAQL